MAKFKIAVQMFGNLRTYKDCAPYLKKYFLDQYKCDIFMHTWSDVDHNSKTWHEYKKVTLKEEKSITELEQEIKENYPITSIKIEKQTVEDLGNIKSINKIISLSGIKNMLQSMHQATKLREDHQTKHNIKYDFVLVTRPDILLKEHFNIEDFLERLTQEEIEKGYFTAGFPVVSTLNDLRFVGASDVLFFAKPEVVSKVFSKEGITKVFNDLENNRILEKQGPESKILEFVQSIGFKVYLLNYLLEQKFSILRVTEEVKKPIKLRKKIIFFRLRRTHVTLCLLSGFLPKICRFQLSLFGGLYDFNFAIGKSDLFN